jgi:hypothetical protein
MAAGIHSSTAAPKGTFNGRVVAEWLGDGRKMRLVEPFEFIGPDARRWPVPAGTVVDGASIPQVFWSLIGGPFEGPYRNASVIHDYYCDLRTRRFRDVHRMFYDGMLASGVGDRRARLMYEAVDRFGPTWADPKIDAKCEVINEKYDFEKCAKNWRKPSVAIPGAGREELLRFAAEVEGTADAADIATLRRAIAEIK